MTASTTDAATKPRSTLSAFAPFGNVAYRVLWGATLVSNIGIWMFNVTSGWLMAELAPSPLMVSLVQAATSLPIFLFGLPAGALGDLFDRRRLLLITQLCAALALGAFTLLLWTGLVSAVAVLGFTFLTGLAAAFSMPAWQAIVPRLVPRSQLGTAVALNGVAVNLARAVGPAVGGFLLATAGAALTVGLDAVCYLAVMGAVWWWRPETKPRDNLPREPLVGAMQAGLRYAMHSIPLAYTVVRSVAFFAFASAYWALLPLVAKNLYQGGPTLYGLMMATMGGGALVGAVILPNVRQRLQADWVVAGGTLLTAAAMLIFALGGPAAAGLAAGALAGIAWITVVSSLNISTQVALPDWVRARGLAIFQMTFFGAMTAGSVLWGQLGNLLGLPLTLALAAGLALVAVPLTWRYKLNLGEHHNHLPSGHWPEPFLAAHQANSDGPVLIQVEYFIDDADRQRFYELIHQWGRSRRRDGAIGWGFFKDTQKKGRFLETYVAQSWTDHLRQHRRVSHEDRRLQEQIYALHQGPNKPQVTHAIAPRRRRGKGHSSPP